MSFVLFKLWCFNLVCIFHSDFYSLLIFILRVIFYFAILLGPSPRPNVNLFLQDHHHSPRLRPSRPALPPREPKPAAQPLSPASTGPHTSKASFPCKALALPLREPKPVAQPPGPACTARTPAKPLFRARPLPYQASRQAFWLQVALLSARMPRHAIRPAHWPNPIAFSLDSHHWSA